MAEKTLREPNRGEKSELVRKLLAEHPDGKNMELAAMFADRMRQQGIKEDRDMKQIAQAFANEKAAAKKKTEDGGTSTGNGKQAPAAAPAATKRPASAARPTPRATTGAFTLLHLEAVEALANEVGGYEHLSALVQFLAARGR